MRSGRVRGERHEKISNCRQYKANKLLRDFWQTRSTTCSLSSLTHFYAIAPLMHSAPQVPAAWRWITIAVHGLFEYCFNSRHKREAADEKSGKKKKKEKRIA